MYTNSQRYISPVDSRDDYINLNLSLGSSKTNWDIAINMLNNRIRGRYIEPMNALVQMNPNSNGFTAMAICCLLIETLMQFREGYPQTPNGSCKRDYSKFLAAYFPFEDIKMAEQFYTDIRCGILHAAQTQHGSWLTFDTDFVVKTNDDGILMVDVTRMCATTTNYFEKYCEELRDYHNYKLRNNFIYKMNHITRIWEGNTKIDELWTALCKNGYSGKRRKNSGFLAYKATDKIVSKNIIKIDDLYIRKDEIEAALYYWPNKTAINKFNNGYLIIGILEQYKNITDEIIGDRSA